MAGFRQFLGEVARKGASDLLNMDSESSLTVISGKIHIYIIETNSVRVSYMVGKQRIILPGVYPLAYPHDMMELLNPKKGNEVIVFRHGRFSNNGFALLSHDTSHTAFELTRVGGEIFIGGVI